MSSPIPSKISTACWGLVVVSSHHVRPILLSMTTRYLLVGRRTEAVINLLRYTFLTNLPRNNVATCQWPVCLIPAETSEHRWPSFCKTDRGIPVTTLFVNHIQVRFLLPPDELVSSDSKKVYQCWSLLRAAIDRVSVWVSPCRFFRCISVFPYLCRRSLF